MRELLLQANRLRSDRLIIDDVQTNDVFDVLATLASRRDGCIAGVHLGAESGQALGQLKTAAKLSNPAADGALTSLLSAAVHVLIQVERTEEGDPRLVAITEVTGTKGSGKSLSLNSQDLFIYEDGFEATGNKPSFSE
jgi:pilus assembly protein CpaF